MNDIPVIMTQKDVDAFVMQIPECCREGHPDCPHVIKEQKKQKPKNIGL